MLNRFRHAVVIAAALTIGGILSPQPAQAEYEPGITVDITALKCGAEIVFTNDTEWYFWGDFRGANDVGTPDSELPPLPADPVDYGDAHDHGVAPGDRISEGPAAGKRFGRQFNPVLLAPGARRVVEVDVMEPMAVWAAVLRGPEQSRYVPWQKLRGIEPCSDPGVVFRDLCEGTLVYLANGPGAYANARFQLEPTIEGVAVVVELEPGRHPDPLFYPADAGAIAVTDLTSGEAFVHQWTFPEECEEDPSTPPVGDEEPDTEPVPVGELPETGNSPLVPLVAGGLVALALGGGLYLFARRRRITFGA